MDAELEQSLMNLNLAWRQRGAVFQMIDYINGLINFKIPFRRILATILAIFECLGTALLDTPRTPSGETLDLSGYELVFCDEFEGNTLNTDNWNVAFAKDYHYAHYSSECVTVKDGNLIITGQYLTDGIYGEGWYAGRIESAQEFCQGYYEVRAILSENFGNTQDFWSSFWITGSHVYDEDISQGGPGGCEIDIFESHSGNFKLAKNRKCVTHAVWCNGYDDNPDTYDGRNLGSYYVDEPFTKYNTYGLKWTKDEYIWYINGVETVRSSYPAGVSQVGENVVLSLAIPVYQIIRETDNPTEFKIDYIKIYQTAEDAAANE